MSHFVGFGFQAPGAFNVQYFAQDQAASPSSVQDAVLPTPDEAPGPELVITFGDVLEDGTAYTVWQAQGMGTAELGVEEEGDVATLTAKATARGGVEIDLTIVCRGAARFSG